MAAKDKKYYWLKLKRDFFKRHDMQIIESMPNGKDYILFYLKLLCESVDHEGNLRFNDEIPYNEQMLSVITNTNIDIVRSAVKIFTELKMMDTLDDGTLYMNEVNKMLGSETYWAQRKREKKKEIEALKDENVGNFPIVSNESSTIVQRESNKFPTSPGKSKSKSIELDIEKEIDIEPEIDITPLTPLKEGGRDSISSEEDLKSEKRTSERASVTDRELTDRFGPYLSDAVRDWINYKKERRETYKPVGLRNLLSQVEHQAEEHGKQAVIDVIRLSMSNGWKGIIWDRIPKAEPRGISNPFLDPDL